MLIPITTIKADKSETNYASVDAMPASPLKDEILTLLNNPYVHLKHVIKVVK